MELPNNYSDYLVDLSFQGLNRLFSLLFEEKSHQTSYKHLV